MFFSHRRRAVLALAGIAPAEVAAFQKAEIEKWAKVVKAAGVKID